MTRMSGEIGHRFQLGLVNRVFPNDKLLGETSAYVRELAERCSPASLMHVKQQVYHDLIAPLGEAMVDTEARIAESNRRPDFKEGIASFMERRPSKFDRLDAQKALPILSEEKEFPLP